MRVKMVFVYAEGLLHFLISYLCFQSLSLTRTEQIFQQLYPIPKRPSDVKDLKTIYGEKNTSKADNLLNSDTKKYIH